MIHIMKKKNNKKSPLKRKIKKLYVLIFLIATGMLVYNNIKSPIKEDESIVKHIILK